MGLGLVAGLTLAASAQTTPQSATTGGQGALQSTAATQAGTYTNTQTPATGVGAAKPQSQTQTGSDSNRTNPTGTKAMEQGNTRRQDSAQTGNNTDRTPHGTSVNRPHYPQMQTTRPRSTTN